MALATYDLTATEVLKYLPQYGTRTSVLPNDTDIAADGRFMDDAASDLADAFLTGGFGTPTLTSSVNEVAYHLARGILARRCALYYASSIQHLLDEEKLASAWSRSNAALKRIESGARFGELTVTSGSCEAVYAHGDSTDDDMEDSMFTWEDVL